MTSSVTIAPFLHIRSGIKRIISDAVWLTLMVILMQNIDKQTLSQTLTLMCKFMLHSCEIVTASTWLLATETRNYLGVDFVLQLLMIVYMIQRLSPQ